MADTENNSSAGEEQPATPEPVDEPGQDVPVVSDEADIPDGTVNQAPQGAEGRVGWVWVQNMTSGRRFDVREDRLKHYSGVQPVQGVPVHYGQSARQPKARVQLGQLTGLQEKVAAQPAADEPAAESASKPPARSGSRRGGGQ